MRQISMCFSNWGRQYDHQWIKEMQMTDFQERIRILFFWATFYFMWRYRLFKKLTSYSSLFSQIHLYGEDSFAPISKDFHPIWDMVDSNFGTWAIILGQNSQKNNMPFIGYALIVTWSSVCICIPLVLQREQFFFFFFFFLSSTLCSLISANTIKSKTLDDPEYPHALGAYFSKVIVYAQSVLFQCI